MGIEESLVDENLLSHGSGSLSPGSWVEVSIHDDSLGLADDSVVAGGDLGGGHLGDGEGDGLSLGGDDDDILVEFDVGIETEDGWEHEFGSVADGVDGGILDDNSGVSLEHDFEWHDGSSQVGLILEMVVSPLGILDVVHGDEVIIFSHQTTSDSSEFFHVSSDSEKETHMNAECSDVGSGLAGDPEDSESLFLIVLEQLGIIDGSDSEFSLDGGDEGWFLEDGSEERFKGLSQLNLGLDFSVQSDNTNVLFSCSLLTLNKSGSSVQTDN